MIPIIIGMVVVIILIVTIWIIRQITAINKLTKEMKQTRRHREFIINDPGHQLPQPHDLQKPKVIDAVITEHRHDHRVKSK